MLLFITISALLSLAIFMVLIKSLQEKKRLDDIPEDEYTSLYEQRKTELDNELENGSLDKSQYQEILLAYQKQLYVDLQQQDKDQSHHTQTYPFINFLIALAAPLLGITIYLIIGGGQLAIRDQIPTMADLENNPEKLLRTYANKLETEGGSAEEWHLLAKSYRDSQKYSKALDALNQAIQQEPDNMQLEADSIELFMLMNNNEPSDESKSRLAIALETAPNHPKLLWLAAIEASYNNDSRQQIAYLERLALQIPEDAPQRKTIEKIIDETKDRSLDVPSKSASDKTELTISITIDDELKQKIQTSSILFVYAKASSGSPIPIAVARVDPNNIPLEVILNDQMAMTPNMTLSDVDNVDIFALISHTGTAQSSSGDLQGSAKNISIGNNDIIRITIDSIIP